MVSLNYGFIKRLSFSLLIAVPFAASAVADFRVDVTEAPTTNLALTVNAIQSAKQSIFLNIYELSSPEITDALVSQIRAGIHVEILEEGQPVGGLSTAAKGIQTQLAQAMRQASKNDHLYVMTSKATQSKRRFRFDHAKYAVIDDTELLIGSENYSPTGNPQPGTKGNRGWEVLVHEPAIAREYKTIFVSDADTSKGDVTDFTNSAIMLANFDAADIWAGQIKGIAKPPKKPKPLPNNPSEPSLGNSLNASSIMRVTSPDTSLSGLVNLINQARSTIDIQQMTFDSAWSGGSNPLIAAIEQAGNRGVQVRVLLNDEAVFNHPSKPSKPKNQPTVDTLNKVRNVSAKIANLKGMGVDYIHNKGALVDGNLTLVSSINWDENSIQHNREAAVVITSTEVFAHYEALFESDWRVSAGSNVSIIQPLLSLDNNITFANAGEDAKNCPAALDVNIKIGKLAIDEDDESFASLENSKIAGSFIRSTSTSECTLVSNSPGVDTSKKQYVEIRTSRDGKRSFIFEGYTNTGNKLYSVRAKIEASLSGHFDAAVYDGSAAHEFLGKAILDVKEPN